MTARTQDEPSLLESRTEWEKARDLLVAEVARLKQAEMRAATCKACGKPSSLNVDDAEQMVLYRARRLAELTP